MIPDSNKEKGRREKGKENGREKLRLLYSEVASKQVQKEADQNKNELKKPNIFSGQQKRSV